MPPKTKEVGGGPATGLANDFLGWLSQGLNTGTFGAGNPAGTDANAATRGMGGILNDMLAGGAGNLGGAFTDMISKQSERDVGGLRARFGAGGGTAFGSGAQYAESMLRSETAPKMTAAAGGLQMQALQMLLPLFANMSGKGITQRQTVQQQNPWAQAAGFIAPIAAAAFTGGASIPATAGMSAGSAMASQMTPGIFNGASNLFAGAPSLGSYMPGAGPGNYLPQDSIFGNTQDLAKLFTHMTGGG
ncbi:MAG: hypothetical protein H0U60_09850 [Blastocatellia bacterium]|nr:hypothetical protein [Blastocatellia bacterium]